MPKQRDPNRWLPGSPRRPTPAYQAWAAMRQRCRNPRRARYNSYGGRGISICPEWEQFEAFLADMGTPPPGHTLERIDVNGHYGPNNCVWATKQAQANNKTTNHMLSFNGKTQSLADWCRDLQLPYSAIRARLQRGWSAKQALLTPVRNTTRYDWSKTPITINGLSQSLRKWCAQTGVSLSTACCRLERGWTPQQAISPATAKAKQPATTAAAPTPAAD